MATKFNCVFIKTTVTQCVCCQSSCLEVSPQSQEGLCISVSMLMSLLLRGPKTWTMTPPSWWCCWTGGGGGGGGGVLQPLLTALLFDLFTTYFMKLSCTTRVCLHVCLFVCVSSPESQSRSYMHNMFTLVRLFLAAALHWEPPPHLSTCGPVTVQCTRSACRGQCSVSDHRRPGLLV